MRKRDGKTTSTLEAQVCELQGKTIINRGSPRRTAAPGFCSSSDKVCSGQFLR